MPSEKRQGQKRGSKKSVEDGRSLSEWNEDDEEEIFNLPFNQYIEAVGVDHEPNSSESQSGKV